MAYYTIGDVAERCGINPVTLRAWQRRYGLLKPQRSEGGHRQFDDADIQRIEEIKYWMSKGVSVGKVKALLERSHVPEEQLWVTLQEEMMLLVRKVNPGKLREKITSLSREHSADLLIDNLLLPVRQKLSQDESTALLMRSLAGWRVDLPLCPEPGGGAEPKYGRHPADWLADGRSGCVMAGGVAPVP